MKFFGTIALYILAFGVAGYAVFAYAFMPLGALVHPDMQVSFLAHRVGVYTHVFASVVALSLGPLQFSGWLRRTRPRIHRAIGRTYLCVGVGIGGLFGLYISAFAFGGMVAKLGFACMAVLWLYTGIQAFRAIRRGAVHEHRKWVVRNFALTLAAVTLRIYLPSSMIAGIPFDIAYPIIAWLCWVPNLIVADLAFTGAYSSSLESNLLGDSA